MPRLYATATDTAHQSYIPEYSIKYTALPLRPSCLPSFFSSPAPASSHLEFFRNHSPTRIDPRPPIIGRVAIRRRLPLNRYPATTIIGRCSTRGTSHRETLRDLYYQIIAGNRKLSSSLISALSRLKSKGMDRARSIL